MEGETISEHKSEVEVGGTGEEERRGERAGRKRIGMMGSHSYLCRFCLVKIYMRRHTGKAID